MELKLSDCFENTDNEAPCLECTATMLNINYGHNQELMKHCRRLKEYSIFVQCVREYIQSEPSVEDALEKAIDTCIHQDVLADFLKKHRAEVTNMILTTYDKNLYEKTLSGNGILIMGNEGNGIRPAIKAFVNEKLYIPNYPEGRDTSESLNVAIATAVVCAEFRRRQGNPA